MYKLSFEEAKEPEIKLPTFIGSWREQGNFRKTSTSASLTTLKPLTVWITTNCGKFLKIWEYLTTLHASWETCMQVKKQQLEPAKEQQASSKIGKIIHQSCILSCIQDKAVYHILSCLLNLYVEYNIWNVTLDEWQGGMKTAWRNINNLRYAKWKETKEPLNKGERGEWKSWFKDQHYKN